MKYPQMIKRCRERANHDLIRATSRGEVLLDHSHTGGRSSKIGFSEPMRESQRRLIETRASWER